MAVNEEGNTNFNKRTIQTSIRVVYRVHEELDSSNLCSGLVSLVMFTGGSRSQHIPQSNRHHELVFFLTKNPQWGWHSPQ